jgi:hypothetical protein
MRQPIATVNIARRVEQNEVAILCVASCLVAFQARPGSHFGPNFVTKIAAIGVKTRRIQMDALLRKRNSKWSHLSEKNRYQQQTEIQNCLIKAVQFEPLSLTGTDYTSSRTTLTTLTTLGNHYGANAAVYYDIFSFPVSGESGGVNSRHRSFPWGGQASPAETASFLPVLRLDGAFSVRALFVRQKSAVKTGALQIESTRVSSVRNCVATVWQLCGKGD